MLASLAVTSSRGPGGVGHGAEAGRSLRGLDHGGTRRAQDRQVAVVMMLMMKGQQDGVVMALMMMMMM